MTQEAHKKTSESEVLMQLEQPPGLKIQDSGPRPGLKIEKSEIGDWDRDSDLQDEGFRDSTLGDCPGN